MKLHLCAGTRAQRWFPRPGWGRAIHLRGWSHDAVNNAGVPFLGRYGKPYERNFRL